MNTLRGNAESDRHGWIGTETVKTRVGNSSSRTAIPRPRRQTPCWNSSRSIGPLRLSYPNPGRQRHREHRGIGEFGAKRSNQIVIWETLMDAETIVLTANTETVYGIGPHRSEERRTDGRSKHRPRCSVSRWTRFNATSWTLARSGRTRATEASIYSSHRDTPVSPCRERGYFVVTSPTYRVGFGVRGFKVDGKTDQAVALMKQIKVYPLAQASSPPAMEFLNGSGKAIDTIHPTPSSSSRCCPNSSTKSRRSLHTTRTVPNEGHWYREGQAVQSRFEDQDVAL